MEGFFQTVPTNLQLYTQISCIFAVQSLHKRLFQAYTSLQQGTCVLYCGPMHTQLHVHVNGTEHAKSASHWSCLAGSCLPQRLFCTKSSLHGISVIKTIWSLTTEVVKSSLTTNIIKSSLTTETVKISFHCIKKYGSTSYLRIVQVLKWLPTHKV